MAETSSEILKAFEKAQDIETNLKSKFNMSSNPFPKSGIADLDEPDDVKGVLIPVSQEVQDKIVKYIINSMSDRGSENRYLSLVVTGEYGTGKTQTLLFIEYLLKHYPGYKPFVVYLDNPGKSLSELIGNVISEIGIENFKRYLWNIYMSYVDANFETKSKLLSYMSPARLFTKYGELSATSEFTEIFKSYKELADAMLEDKVKRVSRIEIEDYLVMNVMQCFVDKFKYTNIARYYLGIVSENISLSNSWELIAEGKAKDLEKKEVVLLNSIVEIVKTQMGYTDFYLLVDEFEEVASNRLSKKDADNYLNNLRTLIDREKRWCSVFAMNPRALEDVKQVSLALYGRISNSVVTLTPFNPEQLSLAIKNYISTVRENNDSISPFENSAIIALFNAVNNPNLRGSPRYLLKMCYRLLQSAAENLDKGQTIDAGFVNKFMEDNEE